MIFEQAVWYIKLQSVLNVCITLKRNHFPNVLLFFCVFCIHLSYRETPFLMMFNIVLYENNTVFETGMMNPQWKAVQWKAIYFTPGFPAKKCLAELVHHTDPDASRLMINLVYLQQKQTAFLCGITVGAAVIKTASATWSLVVTWLLFKAKKKQKKNSLT